jgi:hypothetical protein
MAKQQSADVSDPAAGLNSLPEIARPTRRTLAAFKFHRTPACLAGSSK